MNTFLSRKIVIAFLYLAFLHLTCSGAFPFSNLFAESSKKISVDSTLKKSLLIPGWGQLAEKRYLEGVFFLTAEAYCLFEVFSLNHKGNESYKKYREAETPPDAVRFRDLTEKYDGKRNAHLLAAAGVWVLNLVDAYLIVKNKKNSKIKLNIQSGQDQMVLSVSYSF